MKNGIRPLFFIGAIGTLVTGSMFLSVYLQAVLGNKDIWWTPKPMALSLEETRNEFQLSLRGESLKNCVEKETLTAIDPETKKKYKVTQDDVKIRLNNWNKEKVRILHLSVMEAFLFGASLACLLAGSIQWIADARKKQNLGSEINSV